MKKKIIVPILLIGVLWIQPALADIGKEVMKASERAVGDAISGILAETIQESEVAKVKDTKTLWIKPGYNSTEMEVKWDNGDALLKIDTLQFLSGFLYQRDNWYLGISGGYSLAEMDLSINDNGDDDGLEISADMISLGPSVTRIFYRGEGISSWCTLHGTWYRLSINDVDFDDPGNEDDEDIDDSDMFDFGLSVHLMKELTESVTLMGGIGVNVCYIDMPNTDEAWRSNVGGAIKYSKGSFRAKMAANLYYSLEKDESLSVDFGPDFDWTFDDKYVIGLSYRYGMLLDQKMIDSDEIDLDIHSHMVTINLRILF